MALKIWGDDPDAQPRPRQKFSDDVVGRFRSGHQLNGRPASLSEWRVTTGDPEVAAEIHDLLGGDAPQEWEARGEDNLEVFTASNEVRIIIESEKSLRQEMILFGRNNKIIQRGDGETITYPPEKVGPDPDAALSFQERKAKAQEGTGPEPQVELYFRLADNPDLGIFKFQSGSWGLVRNLAADGVDEKLRALGGPALARLYLEEVSFVAKNGPRAGQTVSYTASGLELLGAYEPEAA